MKILVIRFSAMGDVALCLPVLREALNMNPELQIDFLTNSRFQPIFANIQRLNVINYNSNKFYIGLIKLLMLFNHLRKNNYSLIIDLHDSLRSKILKFLFSLSRLKHYSIDKGRKQKKDLLGNVHQQISPLIHSTERYAQVFISAGFLVNLANKNFTNHGVLFSNSSCIRIEEWFSKHNLKNNHLIGIAPFSQHELKEWPLEKMLELIKMLIEKNNCSIFLFGAGEKEYNRLKLLHTVDYNKIYIVADHFNLSEELVLMSKLNCMISMDSANMHLADLSHCPLVYSIWGPTHSNLGFAPFFQGTKNIIEIPVSKLTCRPCSIYGNTTCSRGDHACMNWINSDLVFEKINKCIN
ncbi:MAG: glycosyltransferase family 9 protein [Saprospiraceae bacterium]